MKEHVMPMPANEIIALIKAGIPDAEIEMTDLAGDNDHWQAVVTSAAFAGKLRVAQHQMVYAALGSKMGNELHALALETKTPSASK
ncbi:MAG: BolA family transcriptional regulator [Maricaulis sp.]|nr:BolA family transcriptional regulator [Maricaulis sp.]